MENFIAEEPICKHSHKMEILGSKLDQAQNWVPAIMVNWQNLDGANSKGSANPKFNDKLWLELTYHGGFHKVFCPSLSHALVFLAVYNI